VQGERLTFHNLVVAWNSFFSPDAQPFQASVVSPFGAAFRGLFMAFRETQYRGYTIEADRKDHYWHLTVHPMRADVPILGQPTFSVPEPTVDDAISTAKSRIDRLLAVATPVSDIS